MKSFRRSLWILFLMIITGLCSYENAIAQQPGKWRIKNRLQFSYEFDNNIRESPSDTSEKIKDSSLRFLIHSHAVRSSQKTRLIFTYCGGLQTYFLNPIENKLINEIEARIDFKVDKFTVGLKGSGRLKIFINDILDYGTGAAELYFRLPPIFKFGNEVTLRTAGLTYRNFPAFDFSQNQIRWTISKRLGSRFTWRMELSTQQVKYERMAIDFVREDSSLVFWDFKQKDHNYKSMLELSYVKSLLINLNYSFQRNDSNSFGYDYYRHQITLVFGFPFTQKIWLRGYGAIQIKNYSEMFFPRFPTDIDTERQESNFFILDLSKDLSANLTILIRFAYYNNESVIRSRFYQKKIVSLGFDLRL